MTTTKRPPHYVLEWTVRTTEDGSVQADFFDELTRGEVRSFDATAKNVGAQRFPGGEVIVHFREHGPAPSPNPFDWRLTTPFKIPRLSKGEIWELSFRYRPIVAGVCVITLEVTATTKGAEVELRGSRGPTDNTLDFYFWVLDRLHTQPR